MKESEAKEKWCPMGRVGRKAYIGTYNQWGVYDTDKKDWDLIPMSLCLGSRCMWWAWDDENPDTGEALQPRTHGHCGHIPRARRICISRGGEVTHIPDHLIIEYRPGEEWRTVALGEEE